MGRRTPFAAALVVVLAAAVTPHVASAVTVTIGEPNLTSTSSTRDCGSSNCKLAGVQIGLPAGDGRADVPADGTIVAWRAVGSVNAGGYVCLRVFRPLPDRYYESTGSAGCDASLPHDLSGVGANQLSSSTPGREPIPVQAGDLVGFEVGALAAGGANINYAAPGGADSPWALFTVQPFTSPARPAQNGDGRIYMINADVQLDAPTITSVTPASGDVGGGTTVTIEGQHLADATRVAFGGIDGAIVSNSNTEIQATSPAHAAGPVDVTVDAPGGTTASSAADQFVYLGSGPPVLSGLRLSRGSFIAANTGPSVTAAAGVGTRVRYSLSEPATTKFRVQRRKRGVRKHGRCVAGKPHKGHRRCTRYVRVKGSFEVPGQAGPNSFRFMGRLRGKALKRGRYRLVAVATDSAGRRSKPKRRAFKIVG